MIAANLADLLSLVEAKPRDSSGLTNLAAGVYADAAKRTTEREAKTAVGCRNSKWAE
jgi:hypothetical protein